MSSPYLKYITIIKNMKKKKEKVVMSFYILNVITIIKKKKEESYNEFSISNQFSLGWKTFRSQVELGTELLEDIFN